MLGLLFLYFIWKYYAELAFEYHKHRWGYGLLGIAVYYIGTFLGGILLVAFALMIDSDFVDKTSDTVLGVMALPIGLLSVWGFYKFLKKKWSRAGINPDSLDGDLPESKDSK